MLRKRLPRQHITKVTAKSFFFYFKQQVETLASSHLFQIAVAPNTSSSLLSFTLLTTTSKYISHSSLILPYSSSSFIIFFFYLPVGHGTQQIPFFYNFFVVSLLLFFYSFFPFPKWLHILNFISFFIILEISDLFFIAFFCCMLFCYFYVKHVCINDKFTI